MNYIHSYISSLRSEPSENMINSKRRKLALNLFHKNKFIDSAKTWIKVSDKTSNELMTLIWAVDFSFLKSDGSIFDLNEINSILSACQIKLSEFTQYTNLRLIAHRVYKRISAKKIIYLNKEIDVISKKFEIFLLAKNDNNCLTNVLPPELTNLIIMHFPAMTSVQKEEIIKINEICDTKF